MTSRLTGLLGVSALVLIIQGCQTNQTTPTSAANHGSTSEAYAEESRAAFLALYPVFMHPRCMNCHPKGNQPLQGEDSHFHLQNVQRGQDGKGLFALKCANCHQPKAIPVANMPPAHPDWHLPSASMPMVFEGKTPSELARQMKDPKQNGGKTLQQLIHHVSEDSLVATAWQPREGRTTPTLTQAEAGAKMREWIEKGAAIP